MNKHTLYENSNTATWKTECIESTDELARRGAYQMMLAALKAEIEDYLKRYRTLCDCKRPRKPVRQPRTIHHPPIR